MKKLSIVVLLFAALVFSAQAASYSSKEYFYTVDLPEGWEASDVSDATQVVFSNSGNDAAVVIGVFQAEPGLSTVNLLQAVVDKMRLKGSSEEVDFNGFKAVAGSYQFTMNGSRLTADIVIFNTTSHYFMIMGSSLKAAYKANREDIEALMGSFALDAEALEAGATTKNNKADKTEASAANVKTSSSKTATDSADKAKQYSVSIDWGDLANSFAFARADLDAAVKEGRAIIASGDPWGYYGVDTDNDPHYTETFWARFFQDMYDKNYVRVTAMVEWFKAEAKEKGWSSYDLAVEVIKCVQAIPYERPYQVVTDQTQAAAVLDYFTPNEVAWYDKGDCDTKSMLIIMILRQLGYDVALYFSEPYQHAMAGINLNAKGTYKTYDGKKYYFIEATYPGWNIGDLPPEFGDPAQWTLVVIK
jgi:hypothetical protein